MGCNHHALRISNTAWPNLAIRGRRNRKRLRNRKGATQPICGKVGDTDSQADLTMGNIASALTLQTEETALIEELRAGSEEAFAWLIARYHQPIYSLLARTVHDRADAADLTQEVFVKVFRGVSGFHGESSLRTWIYESRCAKPRTRGAGGCGTSRRKLRIEQEISESESGPAVRLKDLLVDPGESPFDAAVHEGDPGAGGNRR